MVIVKLNEIAKRLGNPSLQGRMNGTVLSLQFLPDAYDAAKSLHKDVALVDQRGYKTAMARFATGNLQTNKSNRGHTELTQSLLDNLRSKARTFTCIDGTVKSYYDSMREKIGRLADDPNHSALNADSRVWELADALRDSDEQVFRNIADAIIRKKNAAAFADALFLLTLAAIFTRPQDLVQLSHLWADESSPAAPEAPCPPVPDNQIPELEFRLNPPCVDGYIDGYRDEAEQILKVLQEPGAHNKIALAGMSGVGKSCLAAYIAHLYQMDGKPVLWMDYKGTLRDTLCDDRNLSIRGLYRMNYRQNTDDYFQTKLDILQRQANSDTLIVFDGFNRADSNLAELLRGVYPVLITTQDAQLDHRLTVIPIDHFQDTARQMELFQRKYGRDIDGEAQETVLKLLGNWNYHTYAICLLAEAMRANPTILASIRTSPLTEVTSLASDPMAAIYPGLYEFVITKSFEAAACPNVLHLLRNLALLPESGIPRMKFGRWLGLTGQTDWALLQTLIDRRLILHNTYEDTIHVHSLVATLVLHDPGTDCWCADLTDALFAECAHAPDAPYDEKLRLLDDVRSVYVRTAKCTGDGLPAIHRTAGMHLGRLLGLLARYEESADIFRTLGARETDAAMQQLLRTYEAQSRIRLGDLERGWICALEDYERSRRSADALSELLRRVHSRSCRNLCECARYFRDNSSAVAYGREAVNALAGYAHEAESVRDLGWAYYQLGFALYMQGVLPESEECFRQTIRQFAAIGETYGQLYAEEMLSQLTMLDGRTGDALKHLCSSRDALWERVGDRHIDYGRSLLFEGNIYRMAGDENAAERAYAEAYKLFADLGVERAAAAEQALHQYCIILDVWAQNFVAVDVAEM